MTDPVNIPVFTQEELDAIYRMRAGTHVLFPVEMTQPIRDAFYDYAPEEDWWPALIKAAQEAD
tara:strand:- start:2289 stop:2477 length:189 start_codon:yes stop_codon:yes gene_type:complete